MLKNVGITKNNPYNFITYASLAYSKLCQGKLDDAQDIVFNLQQLRSNGLAKKGLQRVAGTSGIYEFGEIGGSEREDFNETIATL